MNKKLILINLNKSDSNESITVKYRDRIRWFIFGFLLFSMLGTNIYLLYIAIDYGALINNKRGEIELIKKEISRLREKGKNLSKVDITTLANLENNRFLWAENFEMLGKLTPEDMALTGLFYENNKLSIRGVATTYKGQKEFEQVEKFLKILNSNTQFSDQFSRLRLKQHELVKIKGQDIVNFEIEAPMASIPPISKQIRNIKFAAQSTKKPPKTEEEIPEKVLNIHQGETDPIVVSPGGES
jgi:hypothetical protein